MHANNIVNTKKWLKWALAGAVTAAALWLSFRQVEWGAVRAAFARANYWWVLAAVANTVFTVYALGWRWKLLLRRGELSQKRERERAAFKDNALKEIDANAKPGAQSGNPGGAGQPGLWDAEYVRMAGAAEKARIGGGVGAGLESRGRRPAEDPEDPTSARRAGRSRTLATGNLFRYNLVGQYVNILMPGRLGELARAWLASRESGISGGYVLGTVAVEKALDFFVFTALWVAVPAVFAVKERVRGYGTALILCAAGVGAMAVVAFSPGTVVRAVRAASRLIPRRFRERLLGFAERGADAFGSLRRPGTLAALGGFTLAFVAGQALTNWLVFRAFGMGLSFWAALLVLLAVQVGNLPPSVPGKVGIFEYAVVLALGAFDVGRADALSYAIMLHVVAFGPRIVLGGALVPAALRKVRPSLFTFGK